MACVATLGSFLFGYDTGVICDALPYMYLFEGVGDLHLSAAEEGWLGGTQLVGATFGARISERLSDRHGCRHNILMLAAIFFVGVWATVPVYLSESAPKRTRGRIVAIDL